MDREVILARRAMFVASALSGFVGSRALAQPAIACPDKAPSADELAMARELFNQGVERSNSGDFAAALERLEKAHTLAPHPKLSVSIAQIAEQTEDWALAFNHARLALSCDPEKLGEGRERAEAILQRAETKIARLTLQSSPEGAEIEVDGQSAGTTPLTEPLILNRGRHTITARWPGTGAAVSHSVELAEGEKRALQLEAPPDDCLREPCVCLQPCLEPPLTEPRNRFGVGLGYTAFVDTLENGNTGHGVNARAFYELALSESVVLRLGLGATPAFIPDGSLIPVGVDLAFLFKPGPVVVGPELSTGYLFADDDVARSSPFMNPKLVLGYALSEQVVVGAQIGPFWSVHELEGGDAVRPGWLSAGAFLSYAFGPACAEDGYPVRCEQPEYESASR